MEAKRTQNNNNKMANSSGLQDLYKIIIYNRFGDEMHSYTISNYEKAIGSLKDDLKLAEIGSRVDISQNGNVIYSETKKDEYANGGGVGVGSYKNHKIGDMVEVWQFGGGSKIKKIVGLKIKNTTTIF